MGYINAGFELKEQIDAGLLPEPDRIYVPLGSMGTTIGLMLGLKIAGVRSRIIGVRVLEEMYVESMTFPQPRARKR